MYMMCSGSFENPEGCSWEDDSLLFGSAYALQDIQPLRPCPLKALPPVIILTTKSTPTNFQNIACGAVPDPLRTIAPDPLICSMKFWEMVSWENAAEDRTRRVWKPLTRPVLATWIRGPEALTVIGFLQSSLSTLPGRLCALSPCIRLMCPYLHPTGNPCSFLICFLFISQPVVVIGYIGAGLVLHLLLKFSTRGFLAGAAWHQAVLTVKLLLRLAFCSQINMNEEHRILLFERGIWISQPRRPLASLPTYRAGKRFSTSFHGRWYTLY